MAMKHLCIFVLFICLASCAPKDDAADDDGNDIVACGVRQPQKNLPWLKAWIEKAETDQTLNCLGTIWLVQYKGQDLFVTNMMLGSGGIMYWFLDCSGNHLDAGGGNPSVYTGVNSSFSVEDPEDFSSFVLSLRLHENKDIPVIYSNVPF
jgi:hypothetical protein